MDRRSEIIRKLTRAQLRSGFTRREIRSAREEDEEINGSIQTLCENVCARPCTRLWLFDEARLFLLVRFVHELHLQKISRSRSPIQTVHH